MAEKEMQKGLSSLAQAWPAARGDVRDGYVAARDLDGEGGFFCPQGVWRILPRENLNRTSPPCNPFGHPVYPFSVLLLPV